MSRLFVKTISATAGNATFSLVPPTSRLRWKVHSFRITYVADATVANRTIRLLKYNTVAGGLITDAVMDIATAVTASQTKTVSMSLMIPSATWTNSDHAFVGINQPIVLDALMALNISAVSGVAGDSFSGYAVIEEEPSGS